MFSEVVNESMEGLLRLELIVIVITGTLSIRSWHMQLLRD